MRLTSRAKIPVKRQGVVAAVLSLALVAGAVPAIWALAPTTERVSLAQDGSQGNAFSANPAISADGRFVAFQSEATNLVGFDTNVKEDVFVRDRGLGTTERMSIASGGAQATDISFTPAISADGRFVAFVSSANNLVSGDTNGVSDVFVRDRIAGTTERVSVSPGEAEADGASTAQLAISPDGRFVVFRSTATNLVVANDTNGKADIFIRDRTVGTTERMSIASGGAEGDGDSSNPAISADGRYVAFQSTATNLVANDTNGQLDVFVRDRSLGKTERVSVASNGTQASGGASLIPAISGDGRYVAFESFAANLVSGDTNVAADIFVHDRVNGATERVSVASDGSQATGSSRSAAISADGRFVAFRSSASNLVPGDTGGTDVFVYDRATGSTERANVASDGSQGNDDIGPGPSVSSQRPAISPDGRFVAFESGASNLVANDTNGVDDVFLRYRATSADGKLTVGDVKVAEGSATDPGTLVFTVNLAAAISQDVSFRFWTEDVGAHDGGDYHGTFGSRTIPAGATSTNITVPLFGDSVFEKDEKFNLNLDLPVNAFIADGKAAGTILNDDTFGSTGTFELEPPNATVAVGEHLTYQLTWTVPKKDNWHDLQSVELRIGDGGSVIWVRFDEASGLLSLVDPSTAEPGTGSSPGSHNRLETPSGVLYLEESSVKGSGPTGPSVTLNLGVSFKGSTAGQSEPVEVRATNDSGQVQGWDHAATVTVKPRGG